MLRYIVTQNVILCHLPYSALLHLASCRNLKTCWKDHCLWHRSPFRDPWEKLCDPPKIKKKLSKGYELAARVERAHEHIAFSASQLGHSSVPPGHLASFGCHSQRNVTASGDRDQGRAAAAGCSASCVQPHNLSLSPDVSSSEVEKCPGFKAEQVMRLQVFSPTKLALTLKTWYSALPKNQVLPCRKCYSPSGRQQVWQCVSEVLKMCWGLGSRLRITWGMDLK